MPTPQLKPYLVYATNENNYQDKKEEKLRWELAFNITKKCKNRFARSRVQKSLGRKSPPKFCMSSLTIRKGIVKNCYQRYKEKKVQDELEKNKEMFQMNTGEQDIKEVFFSNRFYNN